MDINCGGEYQLNWHILGTRYGILGCQHLSWACCETWRMWNSFVPPGQRDLSSNDERLQSSSPGSPEVV